MWTKNWHRFLQGIYGACERVEIDLVDKPWLHSNDIAGTKPCYRGYYRGDLYWIDVFTTATNYQQTKLDTPSKNLIRNSQLEINTIEYCTTNVSAQSIYYKNALCQLGSGQATDEYTAYNLANPITSGFTIQNMAVGTTFDDEENKHKKTLSISLVNSSSSDITVSEFGLFLALSSTYSASVADVGQVSPALVFYESFTPVTISAGAIFRIVIEQEMPVLEVSTQ